MFFESSSELPISVDDRRGKPSDSRLAAAELLADEGVALPPSLSLPVARLPYLFFKYRAQELSAAPSFSVPGDGRSGELSLDLSACEDRLRARSFIADDDADPYPLEAR